MKTNNVSNVSFQANISNLLRDKLSYRATERRLEGQLSRQIAAMKDWGYDTTMISEVVEKGKTKGLDLVNSYFAPFKKVALPFKDSLLDSFLALTKRDIEKAQKTLEI